MLESTVTILSVGLANRAAALAGLPIRLICVSTGEDAAVVLKNELVGVVISRWDLMDIPGGIFLKRLKAAKPDILTIAFVGTGSEAAEISARELGFDVVLSEDVSGPYFRRVVLQLLSTLGVEITESVATQDFSSKN